MLFDSWTDDRFSRTGQAGGRDHKVYIDGADDENARDHFIGLGGQTD
jgi:hypothetical protein